MNNPFDSLYKRFLLRDLKQTDAIYLNTQESGDAFIENDSKVIFDFSDEKFVHLGDALFYIPLILYLSYRTHVSILVPKSKLDFFSNLFADVKLKLFFNHIELDNNYDFLVTVPYCIISQKPHIKATFLVGLGHSSLLTNIPYPLYLAACFADYFLDSNNIKDIETTYENWKSQSTTKTNLNANNFPITFTGDENYFLVSPFIGSGRFRDLFNYQRSKILLYAKNFIAIGYTPILVGSAKDSLIVDQAWIDLRGQPLDLVAATVTHPNVKFGIGFDNFWMHLFELKGKKYLTKFRGRLIKRNECIHTYSVNKSFASSAKWYIK